MDDRKKPGLESKTLDELVAELSEGLLPGEDVAFYDINRFAKRKPAPPSEQVIYAPPAELASERNTPDQANVAGSTVEPESATVVLDTPIRTKALEPTVRLPRLDPGDAETLPDEKAVARKVRAKLWARKQTKEIAFGILGVVVACFLVWLVLTPRFTSSNAAVASPTPVPQTQLRAAKVQPTFETAVPPAATSSNVSPNTAREPQTREGAAKERRAHGGDRNANQRVEVAQPKASTSSAAPASRPSDESAFEKLE